MASTKQKKRSISEVIRGFHSEDVQPNRKSSKRALSKPSFTLSKGSKRMAGSLEDIIGDHNDTLSDNPRLSKASHLRKGQRPANSKSPNQSRKGIPRKKRSKRKPATVAQIPEDLRINRVNYDLSRHRDRFPGLLGENPLDYEEEDYNEVNGDHDDFELDDDTMHEESIGMYFGLYFTQSRLIENLSSELQKLKQNGSNGHVATDSSGRSNSDA